MYTAGLDLLPRLMKLQNSVGIDLLFLFITKIRPKTRFLQAWQIE